MGVLFWWFLRMEIGGLGFFCLQLSGTSKGLLPGHGPFWKWNSAFFFHHSSKQNALRSKCFHNWILSEGQSEKLRHAYTTNSISCWAFSLFLITPQCVYHTNRIYSKTMDSHFCSICIRAGVGLGKWSPLCNTLEAGTTAASFLLSFSALCRAWRILGT